VSFPAIAIGFAFNVIVTSSSSAGHGAITPVAVRVRVTVPVVPEEGMKDPLSVVELGKKVPAAFEVQAPPVAPPVTDPDKDMACPEHDVLLAFATTTAAWLTVMVLFSVSVPHSLVALSEKVKFP
jgi:hypothetical protein